MLLLEKQCSCCKQVLPVEMFHKNRGRRDGMNSQCKACKSRGHAAYFASGGKEKKQAYTKANPIVTITAKLVRNARLRAKEKNLPFDIDLDYIRAMAGENAQFASHCPILGIPLDWSCLRNNNLKILPGSPSLDRIVPERGYVKGNVWIISYRANQIKSDASHEELKLVTKAVGEAIVNSLQF